MAGRRVLAVEDTSTTGGSVLTAVEALREAGAEVVGVAVVVERGAAGAVAAAGLPYRSVFSLADLGLELTRCRDRGMLSPGAGRPKICTCPE